MRACFRAHGIDVKGLSIDVARMQARKQKVVTQKQRRHPLPVQEEQVAFFHGLGAFAGKAGDAWKISVKGPGAPSSRPATSSWPRAPRRARSPVVPIDNDRVLDNEGALAIPASRDAGRRRRRRHRASKWGASGGASVRR